MPVSETILLEFDSEMANVRRTLESVVDSTFDWKPHHNSMTVGELVTHLSSISQWAEIVINQESFDVSLTPQQLIYRSRREVLEVFERITASARSAIAGASDEQLIKPWSLLKGGQVVFTLPRLAVIRNFFLNHSVRHRTQLRAYLGKYNMSLPTPYCHGADPDCSLGR